jgi:hypothetical protein
MKLSVVALALSCLSGCGAERAILSLASDQEWTAEPRPKVRAAKPPRSNLTSVHQKAPELALPPWNVPLSRPSQVLQSPYRRPSSSKRRVHRSMRCWGKRLRLQPRRGRPSRFHRRKPLQIATLWRRPRRSRSRMPPRHCELKLSRPIARRIVATSEC